MLEKMLENIEPDEIKTQIYYAKKDITTKEMEYVSNTEHIDIKKLKQALIDGKIVIPSNIVNKKLKPIGIGDLALPKLAVNIGISTLSSSIDEELEKTFVSLKCGAEIINDFSTKDIKLIRSELLSRFDLPILSFPMYEVLERADFNVMNITKNMILTTIDDLAKNGIAIITLHCGIKSANLHYMATRNMPIVSSSGAILARYMLDKKVENPLFEYFDEILEICRKYDVVLALSSAFRAGCVADANDLVSVKELDILNELAKQAREADVQSIIVSGGHIPLHEIKRHCELSKTQAPLFLISSIVTDISSGFDDVSSSIGASSFVLNGANVISAITQKEHLGHPNINDTKQAILMHKIAIHSANIAMKKEDLTKDKEITKARKNNDWNAHFNCSIDKKRAEEFHDESLNQDIFKDSKFCSMCGVKFCSYRIGEEIMQDYGEKFSFLNKINI